MKKFEEVISKMDFDYFGSGQHKIQADSFLALDDAVLLDVRSEEEFATIKLNMAHHCQVLEIPTNVVPDRMNEIPRDKMIGVFCSSGVRAVVIFAYLKSNGYEKVKIIPGGYPAIMEAIMPGKLHKKINKK